MKKTYQLLIILLLMLLLCGCSGHMHQFTQTVIPPTCSTKGYTEYKCSCGVIAKNDFVKELGHQYLEWSVTKEATEQEDGLKERICSVCSFVETETIPKLEHVHKFTETIIPVTCVTPGYTECVCECGYKMQKDYISAPDHTYGDWIIIKEPTEYDQGRKEKKCTICDAKIVLDISKLDHVHNYTKTVKEVTCEEEGYIEYICKCGDSYKEDIKKPLGHNYSDWIIIKETTEYESGKKEKICSICNNKVIEEIPRLPHDHVYEETIVLPTCEQQGYTLYTCKCKESYKNNYIDALGHNKQYKVVTKASFEKSGTIEYYCTKCSEYKEVKETNFFACLHNYKQQEAIPSTLTTPGFELYICEYCVSEYTDVIEPNNNVISLTMSLSEYSLEASKKAITMAEANFKNAINKNQKELFMYPYMSLDEYKIVREFTLNLIKDCKTEEEKTYKIYSWIIDNLNYDISASNQPIYQTFVNKKAVCFGYASLLHDMLSAAGIMSSYISGYTSYNNLSYNDVFSYNINDNCHAWIYAYVNNKVLIMDPTWADGYSNKAYGYNMDINNMYKTHMTISIEEMAVIPNNIDYRLYSNIFYTVGEYTFFVNKGKDEVDSGSLPMYYTIHRNQVLTIKFSTNNNTFSIHHDKDVLGCINKNGFYCQSAHERNKIDSWSYSICNGLTVSINELINYINYLNSNGYNINLEVPKELQSYFK